MPRIIILLYPIIGFNNGTEHQGFLHGFVEALSVILVSELGDKTFFIAAILAMTNNKITVFLSAISGDFTIFLKVQNYYLQSLWDEGQKLNDFVRRI